LKKKKKKKKNTQTIIQHKMGKTIIKVFLPDGQFKSLSVDDSQTSREIEQMMIKKVKAFEKSNSNY